MSGTSPNNSHPNASQTIVQLSEDNMSTRGNPSVQAASPAASTVVTPRTRIQILEEANLRLQKQNFYFQRRFQQQIDSYTYAVTQRKRPPNFATLADSLVQIAYEAQEGASWQYHIAGFHTDFANDEPETTNDPYANH